MKSKLTKGNEAVVYGAILGGATHFFGYPITPASEIAHAAAAFFPATGGFFMQAESEVSSINMLYGASAAGARCMTASSGPGISLMAEGISYMAGCELPCVIVDIQRPGPGLGNIWCEQSDYAMVVKGGGHGNYKNVVFAPNSPQEMCDFTYNAFTIADKYRIVVFILADAYIGQMMEPVIFPTKIIRGERKSWALYADRESRHNCITSIMMNADLLYEHNIRLQEKYATIQEELPSCEEFLTNDSELLFVAFGTCSRICHSVVQQLRNKGVAAGLFRPKTLFPFPSRSLAELSKKQKAIIVLELNNGMMAEDVQLITGNQTPILRYNWYGGYIPSVKEILDRVEHDRAGYGI